MLFSVADLVSLSLSSRPTTSQAESVSFSFPTSGPSLFVGRTLSSSFPSAFVNQSTVVSFVLVWIHFELSQLGIFVNSFVDSLGWLLQGEFVVFPWSCH